MTEMYRIARNSAETIEGKCQPQFYRWCSRHHSQWHAGSAACVAMEGYILLGEQAINYAEPLIRADERERALEFCCRDNAADLRAKVRDLPTTRTRAWGIQGNCPACGRKGLFIGDGGYLTCSQVDCPQPDVFDYAADLRAKGWDSVSLDDVLALLPEVSE